MDDTMFNIGDLRQCIIRPVLHGLDMYSSAAENLLVGTALAESGLRHLVQLRAKVPALGIYQCEPATHDDIWQNFLASRIDLCHKLDNVAFGGKGYDGLHPSQEQLTGNLFYATAIARIHYWRVPKPLPAYNDANQLAVYWKSYYNTADGSGNVSYFRSQFEKYVL